MVNPYRIITNTKEKIFSRSYIVFKTFKELVTSLWQWVDWENFIYITCYATVIFILVFLSVCLCYKIFSNYEPGDCFVTGSIYDDKVIIMREVPWYDDNLISRCKIDDIECVNNVLKSEACK